MAEKKKTVTLTNGDQTQEVSDPSTVTDLKTRGWKVQEAKPAKGSSK